MRMCTQRTAYECLPQSRASNAHTFADVFLAFCRTPLTLFKRLRKDGLKGAREALANWKPWIPTKQGQARCACRAACCCGMLAPSYAVVASMGRRVRLVTSSPFFRIRRHTSRVERSCSMAGSWSGRTTTLPPERMRNRRKFWPRRGCDCISRGRHHRRTVSIMYKTYQTCAYLMLRVCWFSMAQRCEDTFAAGDFFMCRTL